MSTLKYNLFPKAPFSPMLISDHTIAIGIFVHLSYFNMCVICGFRDNPFHETYESVIFATHLLNNAAVSCA